MLRLLRIRNLAVIEAVEVEFEPGFNVLTGETGAGKSIVVEAVGLLLGARATADYVRTGESHATIEALFEQGGAETIVRREITNQGRSRSFINGSLATAAALRDLSGQLVELHGQHEHQALLDPLTHLPLVDHYAALADLVAPVVDTWTRVRTLREQLERSRMDTREKAARLDLIAFQLGEIAAVAPAAGEDATLDTSRHVLASAERIHALCQESYAALYENDGAVLESLGGVWKRVGELAAIDAQFSPYVDARDGIKGHLEDLAFFLRQYAERVDASPGKLQEVEDRLARLGRLKRKYGPTLEDVLERERSLTCERDLLSGSAERAEDLQRALAAAGDEFLVAARELSRKRRHAAVRLARHVETLLAELAMDRTRFDVRFNDAEVGPDAWSERGVDTAEFYVSPNPGEELRPLARIVSGGELSRMMLALKTLTVDDAPGKTLIFDEVDAGIGGRVAAVVGGKLRALGGRFQVLCITHLPQIAARGATHFHIEKRVRSGRTTTSVSRLSDPDRVGEIARMLGGAGVTEAAHAAAQDLIDGRSTEPDSSRLRAKAKGESESSLKRRPAPGRGH